MVSSTVDIKLRDGRNAHLSRADLLAAAETMPESDGTMVEALIEGRRFAAVPLVARALMVSSDLLGRRLVETVLGSLQVSVDDGNVPLSERATSSQRELPTDPAPEPTPDLSPQVIRVLQRLANQWVAVRQGEVLAHADTLRELRRRIGDAEATVLRVGTDLPDLGD